jgi:hypothetical protein
MAGSLKSFDRPHMTRTRSQVTAAVDDFEAARRQEAKRALQELMWPNPQEPRQFRNLTQFIVGNVVPANA